ncbi:unnamed protein product [Linum trigynum]|uniref:Uncharacterized protein n=1 Tax=Linum trigynum TaxID=586398 RepID=A0AAV2FAG5_9ROSI
MLLLLRIDFGVAWQAALIPLRKQLGYLPNLCFQIMHRSLKMSLARFEVLESILGDGNVFVQSLEFGVGGGDELANHIFETRFLFLWWQLLMVLIGIA